MKSKTSSPSTALPSAEKTNKAMADIMKSLQGLNLPMPALGELQAGYLKQATALWNSSLTNLSSTIGVAAGKADLDQKLPALKDKRFSAADWSENPQASFAAHMYLLNARTLMQMADEVKGDEKTCQRIRFAVQQWVDAAAPSNFLALNPEAMRLAIDSKGESLGHGMEHLLHDIRQGHVSQTDESVFEVGRNVATTEGTVVFENALFQLIEYTPLTPQVFETPLLFVPPCINKYYILDLQPENSLIRHAVAQGHRLFVVSWRNADQELAKATWDQYIEDAAIKAISVVQAISGTKKINALGFCVGGTILSTALAVLAARGEHPVASLTLLTTLLDFRSTGVLDIFIDEAMVQMREMTLGPDSPDGGGLLKGKELASTFSFLRPNELVWNYVVGNYLKGESPPPFDLLYWNSDSTNLPGPMYCWYLRNTYLENKLAEPGALTVCGEAVDLGKINVPSYVYASRDDHIVPWDAAYRNTQVLKGKLRFVMGASGHIAGVINPPAKKKRSHWIGKTAALPADTAKWQAGAVEHPGSWWPDWTQWLESHAGKQIAAPKAAGNRQFKAIEPAPGRYVKQKV